MNRQEILSAAFPEAPSLGSHWGVVASRREGNVLYISGQVAFVGAAMPLAGKVGADVTTEQAQREAALCAANGLYRIAHELGGLDAITQVLKVLVFINATDNYTEHPAVGNGASRVLVDVLGEAGRHARSAVGVSSLPLGVPVEVELVVEVATDAAGTN